MNTLKRNLLAFVLINVFFSFFFLDTEPTPNPTSRSFPVFTLVNEGSFQIDSYQQWAYDKSFVNGHYYSDKAPLPTLVVVPFYALLKILGFHTAPSNKFMTYPVQLLGDLLCGSLPFLLILLLTFVDLQKYKKPLEAAFLSMIIFYGTFLFAYAGTYFNHIFAGAFLLVSYRFLKNQKYLWAGVCLGAGILSEYTLALAAPLWILQILFNQRSVQKAGLFFMGLLPWLIFAGIYNFLITGSPFTTANAFHADPSFAGLHESYGFRLPSLEFFKAIWGLSFSSYRGLFFYAPALFYVAALWFLRDAKKLSWKDLRHDYAFPFIFLTFISIALHFTWWGGWCYGPRYLVPMTTLLLYESALYLAKNDYSQKIFAAFSFLGVFCVWLAKITVGYMISERFSFPLAQLFIPMLQEKKINEDNLLSILFSVPPLYANGLWLFLFLSGCGFFFAQSSLKKNSSGHH